MNLLTFAQYVFLLIGLFSFCNSTIGQENFLQFSPDGEYVNVPHDNALNPENFTVEAWVNPCDVGTFDVIAAKASDGGWGEGFVLYFTGTRQIALSVNWANTVQSSSSLPLGSWSHVAATYDGNEAKVYINGVLEGTAEYPDYVPEDGSFTLGYDGASYAYYGSMSEVRFWNIAKDESGLQSLMTSRLTGNEDNLLLYLPLNQGTCGVDNTSSIVVEDLSGNGFDASLIDFDLTGTLSNWLCAESTTANCTLEALPFIENEVEQTCDAAGGTLSINGETEISVCLDNGVQFPISVDGANGNRFWVFLNEDGTLSGGSPGSIQDSLNLSNYGNDQTVRLAVISYIDGIPTGYAAGISPADLEGCFEISNTLIIHTSRNSQGLCCNASISSFAIVGSDATEASVIVGDGEPDIIEVIAASTGDAITYILTNAGGDISQVTESATFDFESSGEGVSNIYLLVFNGIMNFAPEEGRNVSQLVGGCFELSDPIVVTKQAVMEEENPVNTNPPEASGIPTMGEWILISMGLLLMIFGTVAMRQFVFSKSQKV